MNPNVELLKSTRIYRTLQILMAMMVPTAFANAINKEIMLLGLCCVLGYSVIGIHNAIRDKDYLVPKYAKKVMWIILTILVLLSLSNWIIFLTVLAWMILGYIYNTASRFVLFGDSTVLAITHYTLPCFSSALLLGLNTSLTLTLSTFMFVTFWFLMHSKNLKDTKDDKERGYRTLTTMFNHGVLVSILLVVIGFLLMFYAYFLFDLTNRYWIIFTIVVFLQVSAISLIMKDKGQWAVKVIRMLMMLFLLGIIVDKSSNLNVLIIPFCLFFTYLMLFLTKSISTERYIKTSAVGVPD
jgi:4-hydroxybenzoate polyprenyltransferase